MKKRVKQVGLCLLIAAIFWCGSLICDRQKLRSELVRIHVVANSDSAEDQNLKLRVRDAVLQSLRQEMKAVQDPDLAKAYLQETLPVLQKAAEDTLKALGCEDSVTITLGEEAFDTRYSELLRLPAGVYETLRLTIGQGSGKNWWGILFPGFFGEEEAVAAGADFPEGLETALEGEYTIRFACLEGLGKLENILFGG